MEFFGQVSIGILRYIYGLAHEPCIFPVAGQVDLSSQDLPEYFKRWLDSCLNKAVRNHKRTVPILKLWHLIGSFESFSNDQTLLTFYELDSPTAEEINTIKNNKRVLVTNKYAKTVFEMCGCNNVSTVPLFFDEYNFSIKPKSFFDDDRITFNVVGKLEKRKNHHKLIAFWAKKYGNNPKYFLNCAIYNPFLSQEDNQKLWVQIYKDSDFLILIILATCLRTFYIMISLIQRMR